MEKLLEVIRDVELNDLDDYLKTIASSGEDVACFIPAQNGAMLLHGFESIEKLCDQGLRFVAIFLLDEEFDAFKDVDVNIPILPVSQLDSMKEKPKYIIMVKSTAKAVWHDVMYQYFMRQDIYPLFLCNVEEIRSIRKFYMHHILDIYGAYKMLDDDVSRKSFLGVWKAVMTGQAYDSVYTEEMQYLSPGFLPFEGCIAIDGGAFDGETAKTFVDMGAEVYSFELDRNNFPRVEEMARLHGFHAVNKGLWSCKKEGHYIMAGDSSLISSSYGEETVELIDIDTFVDENKISRIDYIKMDIEGAELEALKGAALSITKWKPILAICAYHKREDLWMLIRYINTLRPDYKFAFRHHKIDSRNYSPFDGMREIYVNHGLDLMIPTPYEYVLYAK